MAMHRRKRMVAEAAETPAEEVEVEVLEAEAAPEVREVASEADRRRAAFEQQSGRPALTLTQSRPILYLLLFSGCPFFLSSACSRPSFLAHVRSLIWIVQ
jgi:hypothetical protein